MLRSGHLIAWQLLLLGLVPGLADEIFPKSSVRQLIAIAQLGPSKQAVLPAGVFAGLPHCGSYVNTSLEILGKGSSNTVVDCQGTGSRVFHVHGSGTVVTMTGVAFKGGSSPTPFDPPRNMPPVPDSLFIAAAMELIRQGKVITPSSSPMGFPYDSVSEHENNSRSPIYPDNRPQSQPARTETFAGDPMHMESRDAHLHIKKRELVRVMVEELENLQKLPGPKSQGLPSTNPSKSRSSDLETKEEQISQIVKAIEAIQAAEVASRGIQPSKHTQTSRILSSLASRSGQKHTEHSVVLDQQLPQDLPMAVVTPSSDQLGGCIFVEGASVLFNDVTIGHNCSAPYGGGMAVVPIPGSKPHVFMNETVIEYNLAIQGGGIWALNASIDSQSSRFSMNTAKYGNPTLINTHTYLPAKSVGASLGGALFAAFSGVHLHGITCTNNAASVRADSSAKGNFIGSSAGGCAFIIGGQLNVSRAVLSGNVAAAFGTGGQTMGGAFLVHNCHSSAFLDSNFIANFALTSCFNGGFGDCASQAGAVGMFTSNNMSISKVSFLYNGAVTSCLEGGRGGCVAQGGAVYSTVSSGIIVKNSTAQQNNAAAACQFGGRTGCYSIGGALSFFRANNILIAEETAFLQNSASTACDEGGNSSCNALGGAISTFQTNSLQALSSGMHSNIAQTFCHQSGTKLGCLAEGGALAWYSSSLFQLTACQIIGNEARIHCGQQSGTVCRSAGGGLWFYTSNPSVILSSNFTSNSAACSSATKTACDSQGGGMFSYMSAIDAKKSSFIKNGVKSQSSASGSVVSGGGLEIQASEFTCNECHTIKNSVNGNESAAQGGAIHCAGLLANYPNETLEIKATIAFTDSRIFNNSVHSIIGAGIGGGVRVDELCDAKISLCDIFSNSVVGKTAAGAGIAIVGNLTMLDSKIYDHMLPESTGHGSAIFAGAHAVLRLANTLGFGNQGSSLYSIGNVRVESDHGTSFTSSAIIGGDVKSQAFVLAFVGSTNQPILLDPEQLRCNIGYVPSSKRTTSVLDQARIGATCRTAVGTCGNVLPNYSLVESESSTLLVQCERCQVDYYSLDPDATLSSVCVECPFGAQCLGGAVVKAKHRYWGQPLKGTLVLPSVLARVPPGYGCPKAVCDSYNSCNSGRTGVLCGGCAHGYGARLFSTKCGPNSQCNLDQVWVLPASFILLNIAAIVLLITSTQTMHVVSDGSGEAQMEYLGAGSSSLEGNIVRTHIKVGGRFTILTAYIQMSQLVISSTNMEQMQSGLAHSLSLIFAVFQGGSPSSHDIGSDDGLCIVPGMTSWGRIVASTLFPVCLMLSVGVWSLMWPWLHSTSFFRFFTSQVAAKSGNGFVRMSRLSLVPKSHVDAENSMQLALAKTETIPLADSHIEQRAVAFYQVFEIVYQSFIVACVRCLVNVNVQDLGLRWYYDANVHAGIWQIGPGFVLAGLLILPGALGLFLERKVELRSKHAISFDPDESRVSPNSFEQFWNSVALHHVSPFRSKYRHWAIIMLYRRALLVLIVEALRDPVVRAYVVCTFLIFVLVIQRGVQPLVLPAVQTLEMTCLTLLICQGILQIRQAALISAAAQSSVNNSSLDALLVWAMSLIVIYPIVVTVITLAVGALQSRQKKTKFRWNSSTPKL